MGAISPPKPVKLIVAMIGRDEALLARARAELERLYGAVDLESPIFPFHWTSYYEEEMGTNLLRRFLSFEQLMDPGKIAGVKIAANALEESLATERAAADPACPARPINIDPGYMTLSKLVLASTKDFSHRIYLMDGIYAEVTLSYRRSGWVSYPFTFPDYACDTYHAFFSQVRREFCRQIGKEAGHD
jgi:hypothetical protein